MSKFTDCWGIVVGKQFKQRDGSPVLSDSDKNEALNYIQDSIRSGDDANTAAMSALQAMMGNIDSTRADIDRQSGKGIKKPSERGSVDARKPTQQTQDKRLDAGAGFRYSILPYDPASNRLGAIKIAADGIIPEKEFQAIANKPGQLKNAELEFYKEIAPNAFEDGKVNVPRLYEALQDHGPAVTVTRYGQDIAGKETKNEAQKEYDELRHNWYDNLTVIEQSVYQQSWTKANGDPVSFTNMVKFFNWSDSDIKKALRLHELALIINGLDKKDTTPSATDFYDAISPFNTETNPVIRIDVTFNNREGTTQWIPDKLHENIPNTVGWAMVQPVMNPLNGKPAWFVAELQSRWAQIQKDFKSKGTVLLDIHQPLVLKAVIAEAKKEGIESVIVSDAETAMMTEQHDNPNNLVIPAGTYNVPGVGTYVVYDFESMFEKSVIFYEEVEDPNNSAGKLIKSYNREFAALEKFAKENNLKVIKQEKGMRVAYDTTLPSEMKRITGREGIHVDLGKHKNTQSVFDNDANFVGEGSIYFKNEQGKPKDNVTGKLYDITKPGPKAEMLFADVFGVALVVKSVQTAFQAAKDFAEFASRIIQELGEWIRPHAQKLWDTMKTDASKLKEVVTEIANEAAPKVTGKALATTFRGILSKLPNKKEFLGPASKIEWRNLPYMDRKALINLADAYEKARKGKSAIVKADVLKAAINDAAKKSYKIAFAKAKADFPLSLAGKSETDFTSMKDVRGYIAAQQNAEGKKVRAREASRSTASKTRKDNRLQSAKENYETALGELNKLLDEGLLSRVPKKYQKDAAEAIGVISDINLEIATPKELEEVIAAVQNLADGNWIGVGAILSKARAARAVASGEAIKKKTGNLLNVPLNGIIGKSVDTLSTPDWSQAFARTDVRERIAFVSRIAKEFWTKYFAPFSSDGMRYASSLQEQHTKKIEAVIKKWGFSTSHIYGTATKTESISAKRMGIVSLLTQFRDSSPNEDLSRQLNDVINGINAMQSDKSSIYRGIGQLEGSILKGFLIAAVKQGFIGKDDDGKFRVIAEPDKWTSFMYSLLNEKERGALEDIKALTSQYSEELKWVQEFTYGKQWEPWNNYVMQQAIGIDGQEAVNPEGMDLDASTLAPTDFASPVGKTQSILNPRIGLAKGQFYNLNIFDVAVKGMNQAAYEIGTAQPRMDIKAIMEDKRSDGFWGTPKEKKLTYKIYKDIHQKNLGIETGIMPTGSPKSQVIAYSMIRPLQAWTSVIMGSVTQLIKQWASPLIGYAIADGAIPHLISTLSYIYGSEQWTPENRRKFYSMANPDLLKRIATYDPAYDDLTGSSIVEEIRRISKDGNFVPLTPEQKTIKNLGRVLNFAEGAAAPAIAVSRYVNTKSDAIAAAQIFLSEYSRYLLKNKLIKDITEFTPDLPFDENAARHADQIVTEALGGAQSREKRPNILSYTKPMGSFGRTPAVAARSILLNLQGIAMQQASDTFRSIGEATYMDSTDPEGTKQIRTEAQRRILRNVIQNAVFLSSGYLLGFMIKNMLLFGASFTAGGLVEWEGLDDEEKKILKRMEMARFKAQFGPSGLNEGIQDIGLLLTGGVTNNSVGNYVADKSTASIFNAFFEDDYTARIEALEKERDNESDFNRKQKLQQEIDIAKKVKANMLFQENSSVDGGQLDALADFKEYMMRGKTVSNAEADRIALDYFTKARPNDPPPTKGTTQLITRTLADRFLRLISTDIGRAQDQINKARTIAARKRESQLQKPVPQPIDPDFGALR